MTGRLSRVLGGQLPGAPPIWLMRQADRDEDLRAGPRRSACHAPSSVSTFVRLTREVCA